MNHKWRIPILCLLCLVGPVLFLSLERWYGLWGFPLDDAWIHQTYARGLAGGQGWAYAGGHPSAGSTSPAWTLLQVPVYWWHLPVVVWGYGIGILLLLAVVFLSYRIALHWEASIAWLAACIVAWEWHLVWASLSGMETLLFTAWILLVWWICLERSQQPSLIQRLSYGAILGLGVWIRPEALLVCGLGGFWLLWRSMARKEWLGAAVLTFGALFFIGMYFFHSITLEGRLWPNTLYAKPLEFATLRATDLLSRIWTSIRAINAGSLSCFSWFVVIPCIRFFRMRRWSELIPMLWAGLHLGLYAVQLPVIYQHARYDIPIMPIVIIYGMLGIFEARMLFQSPAAQRLFYRVMIGSGMAISLVFLAIGAKQFALDVGVIETEMVPVAQWIRDNTPVTARVAAHDIGALGYWGNRTIIDLGGLTDEDAWRLLAGQEGVDAFLRRTRADYWMTFPSVYFPFTEGCHPLYETNAPFASLFGEAGMAVYKWPDGCGY